MFLKKINGFFVSFLLGGAIGSVIALLYAPKQGKLLRNDIRRKTNEFIDEGKSKADRIWKNTKEEAGSILDSANDFLNTGKEKIARKTERVKDALESGFDAYKDERKSRINKSTSSVGDVENTQSQRT